MVKVVVDMVKERHVVEDDASGRGVPRAALRGQRRAVVLSSVLGAARQIGEALVPVLIGVVVDRAVVRPDGGALTRRLLILAAVHPMLTLGFRTGARIAEGAAERAGHPLRLDVVRRALAPHGGTEAGRPPGALVGGRLVLSGSGGLGELVSAVGLALFLPGPLGVLARVGAEPARGRASAARIADVLAGPGEFTAGDLPPVSPPDPPRGELRLRGLTHGGLRGLDLLVRPGELPGVVVTDTADAASLTSTTAPYPPLPPVRSVRIPEVHTCPRTDSPPRLSRPYSSSAPPPAAPATTRATAAATPRR
ncbi:hypothetical protein [Streptomyces sp. NPDC058653]|uniref:hypothetical protein n=1 Tax=Streptomyces sp. NPDC058653 TaxID=3346576 RepID=UPI00365C9ED9